MNRPALIALLLICTFVMRPLSGGPATGKITGSPHDMSVSAGLQHPTGQLCIFCHATHGGRVVAPLWNRRDSTATYTPYDSPTLKARPGQPTGSSKLCLSCHDGTIGLGDLVAQSSKPMMGGSQVMAAGHGLIGTDLRDDHPISFAYGDSMAGTKGELAAQGSWDRSIQLDKAGMLQCTTCHDPHNNEWGNFLVMSNEGARLCRECHRLPGFDENPHSLSTNAWKGSGTDPWPNTGFKDVATNACMNCHWSHQAPGKEELLSAERHEDVCLVCHDGSVSSSDVSAAFKKEYRHPVLETSGGHRPGENLTGLGDHVTCVDCHNPHEMTSREADAPFVRGSMVGVSGVTSAGTTIDKAVYEYEVCFKCHGSQANRSWSSINRQFNASSVLHEFVGAVSSHPVVTVGGSGDVPSLLAPLTTQSQIYCSDCHGDDGSAGQSDAKSHTGPHGSSYQFLLKKQYRTGDDVAEGPEVYALCYSCHDRSVVLSDRSWAGHREHVVEGRTSCSVCHTGHGIDASQGTAGSSAHLVNFDLKSVEKLSPSGELKYRALDGAGGTCSLRCHGKDHESLGY